MARAFDDSLLLALASRNKGGGGTSDYNQLSNLPSIGGNTLKGDMSLEDIGDTPIPTKTIQDAVTAAFQ